MQRVKVHELRKLNDSDLVERLTKERVSRIVLLTSIVERARSAPRQQGLIPAPS